MLNWLKQLVGICPHNRTTWPQNRVPLRPDTAYVACLDCGREIDYDVPNWRRRDATIGAGDSTPPNLVYED